MCSRPNRGIHDRRLGMAARRQGGAGHHRRRRARGAVVGAGLHPVPALHRPDGRAPRRALRRVVAVLVVLRLRASRRRALAQAVGRAGGGRAAAARHRGDRPQGPAGRQPAAARLDRVGETRRAARERPADGVRRAVPGQAPFGPLCALRRTRARRLLRPHALGQGRRPRDPQLPALRGVPRLPGRQEGELRGHGRHPRQGEPEGLPVRPPGAGRPHRSLQPADIHPSWHAGRDRRHPAHRRHAVPRRGGQERLLLRQRALRLHRRHRLLGGDRGRRPVARQRAAPVHPARRRGRDAGAHGRAGRRRYPLHRALYDGPGGLPVGQRRHGRRHPQDRHLPARTVAQPAHRRGHVGKRLRSARAAQLAARHLRGRDAGQHRAPAPAAGAVLPAAGGPDGAHAAAVRRAGEAPGAGAARRVPAARADAGAGGRLRLRRRLRHAHDAGDAEQGAAARPGPVWPRQGRRHPGQLRRRGGVRHQEQRARPGAERAVGLRHRGRHQPLGPALLARLPGEGGQRDADRPAARAAAAAGDHHPAAARGHRAAGRHAPLQGPAHPLLPGRVLPAPGRQAAGHPADRGHRAQPSRHAGRGACRGHALRLHRGRGRCDRGAGRGGGAW